MIAMPLVLRRREVGSYVGRLHGVRVAIVNHGEGPRSPRYQGEPAWEVRIGGDGPYDIGARTVTHAWTLRDARGWAEENVTGTTREGKA